MKEELREEIRRVIKIEGECRGVSIESPLNYVELNYEKDKLMAIETILKEFGIPGKDETKVLAKYPIGCMTATHLVIKDFLDWSDDDVEKMGYALPQISFIVRTLSRYFISVERTFQESSNYWKKHFTLGKLVPVEIDIDKKYLILRIEGYMTNPIDCKLFTGYFSRMISYTIKAKEVYGEEVECSHKGGDCHQFVVRWKD